MDEATQPHESLADVPEGTFATDDPRETLNSTRIGYYVAEADTLFERGWRVSMRYDESAGTLAAVICPPKIHAPTTYTIFRPIEPTSIAAFGIKNSCDVARLSGNPIKWEQPIEMGDWFFLGFFAAWREHFQGSYPSGWPLGGRES